MRTGEDLREVLDDVKAAVDAIDTFPAEAEEPRVAELEITKQVINVAVTGPEDEGELRVLGERVRDELLALDGITRAELSAVRPYEIGVQCWQEGLYVRWGGDTLQFAPPFISQPDDLYRMGETLQRVIASVH